MQKQKHQLGTKVVVKSAYGKHVRDGEVGEVVAYGGGFDDSGVAHAVKFAGGGEDLFYPQELTPFFEQGDDAAEPAIVGRKELE